MTVMRVDGSKYTYGIHTLRNHDLTCFGQFQTKMEFPNSCVIVIPLTGFLTTIHMHLLNNGFVK